MCLLDLSTRVSSSHFAASDTVSADAKQSFGIPTLQACRCTAQIVEAGTDSCQVVLGLAA
jgi:hypothetical protein